MRIRIAFSGVEENREILERILAHMGKYHISAYDETEGTGLVRHALIRKGFVSGQIMVCLVLNGDALPKEEELADSLWQIPGD